MAAAPPVAAFLATHSTYLHPFLELAGLARGSGRLRPVMILGPKVADQAGLCEQAGLEHQSLDFTGPEWEDDGPERLRWRVLAGAGRRVQALAGGDAGLAFSRPKLSRMLAHMADQAQATLDALQPRTLVLPTGRTMDRELAFLRQARAMGAHTVVPAVAYAAGPEEIAARRVGPLYEAARYPRLAARHPGQAFQDPARGEAVFYFPAPMLDALDHAGMLPPNPWVAGGGLADATLVAGEAERRRFLAAGGQEGRVRITGQLAHDHLHRVVASRQALRASLCAAYGLDPERPLIILALPQLGEQKTLPWGEHWREMRALAETFAGLNAGTLVSLHPKMDPARYTFLGEEFGLAVATERLAEILPAADVFAASYSTTVEWAGLCGVPAVVFDLWGINYHLYDGLEGVAVVRERAGLAPALAALVDDPHHRQAKARAQLAWGRDLAPLDGGAAGRILSALEGGDGGTPP